jgi:hypothetical protein
MEQQWEAGERFKQFSLRVAPAFSLLPPRHSLVVDRLLSTMLLIDWQNEQVVGNCEVMDDEQFALVLTLLEQWPSYVPYERLLQQLGIVLTSQQIEDLEHLRTSRRACGSEEERRQDEQARMRIRPVLQTLRDLLHNCKIYLQDFGLDIGAVADYGPLLIRYVEARAPQAQAEAG